VAAFKRNPGQEFVSLGNALLAVSQPDRALLVGSRGLREAPRSRAGRLMVGRALIALGRFAEAEEQLRWVVACEPDNERAARLLRAVREQRERNADANRILEDAPDHAPSFVDVSDEAPTQPFGRARSPRATPPIERTPVSDHRPARALRKRRGKILRFTRSERLLHWALALPFLVCLSTAGLLVFYYNPDPTRPYREIVSWVHRGAGLCFVTLPLLVLLFGARSWRVHWDNLKEGLVWRWADFKWLALMPFAIVSRRVRLPEEGKFNAGEKLNFTWVVMSYPLYAATGLAIWFGGSLDVLPWLVHIGLAAISAPLIAGHIFMAVINPRSRAGLGGMFSGWVDRRWAQHHYRRWFREKFGRIRTETGSALIAVGRAVSPAVIAFAFLGLAASAAGAYKLWIEPHTANAAPSPLRYLAGESPLWPEASEEETPMSGEPLAKGDPVTLLATQGEFALVRDATGREGFLFADDLLEQRPTSEGMVSSGPAPRTTPESSSARGDLQRSKPERLPESRHERRASKVR